MPWMRSEDEWYRDQEERDEREFLSEYDEDDEGRRIHHGADGRDYYFDGFKAVEVTE